MAVSIPQISDLSTHLFWDVDKEKLDFNSSKSFIVQRVLEFGLLSDWQAIVSVYGMEQIKQVALQLRSLDAVSLSFLCAIFNLEKLISDATNSISQCPITGAIRKIFLF